MTNLSTRGWWMVTALSCTAVLTSCERIKDPIRSATCEDGALEPLADGGAVDEATRSVLMELEALTGEPIPLRLLCLGDDEVSLQLEIADLDFQVVTGPPDALPEGWDFDCPWSVVGTAKVSVSRTQLEDGTTIVLSGVAGRVSSGGESPGVVELRASGALTGEPWDDVFIGMSLETGAAEGAYSLTLSRLVDSALEKVTQKEIVACELSPP